MRECYFVFDVTGNVVLLGSIVVAMICATAIVRGVIKAVVTWRH